MLIGHRCTICHNTVETNARVHCDVCGRSIHNQCAEYERTFECPECATDLEVGIVEF
ncbi:hypothetical protein C440_04168 [Haloferax mucosum ATCC BAA-1512]|uniref:RING-type domain-containing protein n=1 Tax=Haloferax mucosum ATCC BAA-1512 TaxID=662479 RepID=M0IJG0_9EURY|nr:hypothetical protein C440_04168 [Haloferax mucosum ATCC BAA-1512]